MRCSSCNGPITKAPKTGLCRTCLHSRPWQQRFWSKVDKTDGCWAWTGGINSGGYGQFSHPDGFRKAHRVAYELVVGPIPEGMQLDHLCRNRACVSPAHLEPVTQRENLLRGDTLPAANVLKTHCTRGHAYAGANLYVTSQGKRQCKECNRIRQASYRAAA